MDPTYSFRRTLLRRVLALLGAEAPPSAPTLGEDPASKAGMSFAGDLRQAGNRPAACPGIGRPFLVRGEARTSSAEVGAAGWSDADLAPSLAGLDHAARTALAGAWTEDALREHASVASFARFALQLLAVGAPADLVAQAHRVALDEVKHARWCFGLAEAYGDDPIAPSPFPFEGRVEVLDDLATLCAVTAREGCLGQTLSALMAAERMAHALDPAVRRVLGAIAEDEVRGAELAWRTVAWALEQGGAPAREAAQEVFGNAARHLPFGVSALRGLHPSLAAAHGRIDPAGARTAMVRGIAEVILPCQRALFAAQDQRAPDSGVRASVDLVMEAAPATRRSPS